MSAMKRNLETSNLSQRTKVLAGILAGTALFSVSCAAEEKPLPTPNFPSVSGETTPGVDSNGNKIDYSKIDVQTLTVDEFYDDAKYPQEYRIKWANEIINEREQEAYDEINTLLREYGHPEMTPLVEPSESNTANEILVQLTVNQYIASTTPSIDEGKKLLAAVVDPSSPTFDDILANIEPGDDYVLNYNRVKVSSDDTTFESPIFRSVAIGNYSPQGTASKIMNVGNVISGDRHQMIVRFVGGRYIIRDSVDTSNRWIDDPRLVSDS